MNLVLGTAQFGMDYGITNVMGKTNDKEIKEILTYAKDREVLVLDTSPAYGSSEKNLGLLNLENFNVITKLAYIEGSEINDVDIVQIEKVFQNSIVTMNLTSIYGLFIHNAKDLCKPGSLKLYEKLQSFKKEKLVEKIGVSVYTVSEIEEIYFNEFEFDMIQIPLNILDQRMLESDVLSKLKSKGIEIYARSIFLQGVLLSEWSALPIQFQENKSLIKNYFKKIEDLEISKIEAALKFIDDIEEVDYAVVGVNSLQQLEEIEKAFRNLSNLKERTIIFQDFAINDEKIIDPRKW